MQIDKTGIANLIIELEQCLDQHYVDLTDTTMSTFDTANAAFLNGFTHAEKIAVSFLNQLKEKI